MLQKKKHVKRIMLRASNFLIVQKIDRIPKNEKKTRKSTALRPSPSFVPIDHKFAFAVGVKTCRHHAKFDHLRHAAIKIVRQIYFSSPKFCLNEGRSWAATAAAINLFVQSPLQAKNYAEFFVIVIGTGSMRRPFSRISAHFCEVVKE